MCPHPRKHGHHHGPTRANSQNRSGRGRNRVVDLNQRSRSSPQSRQRSTGTGRPPNRYDNRGPRRPNESPFARAEPSHALPSLPPGQTRLTFLGGANEVGRSCVLWEGSHNYLLDCGIKFGSENDLVPLIDARLAKRIDAVLLSHAHLDHSGILPSLYAMGYNRETLMTKPTRDIIHILLADALRIAKEKGRSAYTNQDLTRLLQKTSMLGFSKPHPRYPVTFYDAGHILGSALTLVEQNGKRVLYTGDMNDRPSRMLKPCVQGIPADTLVMESTYGKRADVHPGSRDRDENFAQSIKDTLVGGGKVIIPSFATGRGQEMLLTVDQLISDGLIPKVPVYLDGMVSKVLQLHHDNSGFLSDDARKLMSQTHDLFHLKHFKRPKTSDKHDVVQGPPCIIITTSGMLNGGPVLQYLEKLAPFEENKIILVGYQAEGTRGREILQGADELEIGDKNVPIRLQVDAAQYSAHADHNGLVNFALHTPKLKKIFLMHGEDRGPIELRESLEEVFQARARKMQNGTYGHEPTVTIPTLGETFSI